MESVTQKQMEAFAKAALAMKPIMDRFRDALIAWGKAYKEQVEPILWAAYERAHMPYGPSEEGLWRWLREQREIYDTAEEKRIDALFRGSVR